MEYELTMSKEDTLISALLQFNGLSTSTNNQLTMLVKMLVDYLVHISDCPEKAESVSAVALSISDKVLREISDKQIQLSDMSDEIYEVMTSTNRSIH